MPDANADDEMLDLALHIIKKKAGRFDPTTFDDRYDAALVELVKAKMEGRKITPPKAPEPTRSSDLLEALEGVAVVAPEVSNGLEVWLQVPQQPEIQPATKTSINRTGLSEPTWSSTASGKSSNCERS